MPSRLNAPPARPDQAVGSGAQGKEDDTEVFEVDRHKLARCMAREVAPLKRWLQIRTGHRTTFDVPPDPDVVVVPRAALAHLATLADCTASQLIHVLNALVVDRS